MGTKTVVILAKKNLVLINKILIICTAFNGLTAELIYIFLSYKPLHKFHKIKQLRFLK